MDGISAVAVDDFSLDVGLVRSPTSRGHFCCSEQHRRLLFNEKKMADVYVLDEKPFARGHFASVCRCVKIATGVPYAAKCLHKSRRHSADTEHEIVLLHAFRHHPNIVRIHEVFETELQYVIILELVAGGELQNVLDAEESLPEYTVVRLVRQLLLALQTLHDNRIAHLDIKPQNILLTSSNVSDADIKLCDFGVSRLVTDDIKEIIGTADYIAPEVINYESISIFTDMWSVGVLTYALLSGFMPFSGDTDQETYLNILTARLDFPHELFHDVSNEAQDFISQLLVKDQKNRMDVYQCLQHPWITEFTVKCDSVSGVSVSQYVPGDWRLAHGHWPPEQISVAPLTYLPRTTSGDSALVSAGADCSDCSSTNSDCEKCYNRGISFNDSVDSGFSSPSIVCDDESLSSILVSTLSYLNSTLSVDLVASLLRCTNLWSKSCNYQFCSPSLSSIESSALFSDDGHLFDLVGCAVQIFLNLTVLSCSPSARNKSILKLCNNSSSFADMLNFIELRSISIENSLTEISSMFGGLPTQHNFIHPAYSPAQSFAILKACEKHKHFIASLFTTNSERWPSLFRRVGRLLDILHIDASFDHRTLCNYLSACRTLKSRFACINFHAVTI